MSADAVTLTIAVFQILRLSLSVCVCTTHSSESSSASRLISVTGSNRLNGSPMIPNLTESH